MNMNNATTNIDTPLAPETISGQQHLFQGLFLLAELALLSYFISPLALGIMFLSSLAIVLLARACPQALQRVYFIFVFIGLFVVVYFLGDLVKAARQTGLNTLEFTAPSVVALGASYCYLRAIYAVREPSMTLWGFARYYFFVPTFFIGPIMRPGHFLQQRINLSFSNAQTGLALAALGLMYFAFSDVLGQLLPLASLPHMQLARSTHSVGHLWLSAILAGVWLYLNFAGMSLVAIGIARGLGIVVPQNFNNPFIATSLTDFWRRWHITLGDWVRLNVFNELARLLNSPRLILLSLVAPALVTMIIVGLWHHVVLSFIVWGALHGVGLGINMIWAQFIAVHLNSDLRTSTPYRIGAWITTQGYVAFTWVFFFPLPSNWDVSFTYAKALLFLR